MSRSGYTEDYGHDEPYRYNLYRGTVARATSGKRGQAMLRELLGALDSMPQKRLAARSFQRSDGDVCALGCLLRSRKVDTAELDAAVGDDGDEYEDDVSHLAAAAVGVARALAAEVMWENDQAYFGTETPEERWQRMRTWVSRQLEEA